MSKKTADLKIVPTEAPKFSYTGRSRIVQGDHVTEQDYPLVDRTQADEYVQHFRAEATRQGMDVTVTDTTHGR